jgi:hypothetical protein
MIIFKPVKIPSDHEWCFIRPADAYRFPAQVIAFIGSGHGGSLSSDCN